MKLRHAGRLRTWLARMAGWASIALIVLMLGLGVHMTQVVEDVHLRFELSRLHASGGVAVFALALAWTVLGPVDPPAPPGRMRAAIRCARAALPALTVAAALSGWLAASAAEDQDLFGVRTTVFGPFAPPDPFAPGDAALAALFGNFHAWCAAALAAALALQAGAARRLGPLLRAVRLRLASARR